MGQKTHPFGFRLAIHKDWRSKWYSSSKDAPALIEQDHKIRNYLKEKLKTAAIPKIIIERAASRLRVTLYTARPGIVIGRKGAELDKLKEEIANLTGNKEIYIDVVEVKNPEVDAQLVAENVALQMERRISFKRAMKKAVQTAMDFGAQGIKIRCAGRLGGAEIARSEKYHEGKVPLHTLRSDIDYGFAEAMTPAGKIGVKVWVCRGLKERKAPVPPKRKIRDSEPAEAVAS